MTALVLELDGLDEEGGALEGPLTAILEQFAAGASRPDEVEELADLERLLSTGARLEAIDESMRRLNHRGYLRGALVAVAAHLRGAPRADLALRLAAELLDAVDTRLGLWLARRALRLPDLVATAGVRDGPYTRANLMLAEALRERGDLDAAVRHYEAIVAYDVDHRRALSGWTTTMNDLERQGRAPATSSGGLAWIDGLEELELTGELGLERYELGRPLGRGRHAVVYEAWDREVGRKVALKRLLGTASSGNRLVERRFFAEARTLARVRSAYVVELLDVQPRHRFVALGLCRGGNLRLAMRRGLVGPDDVPRVGDQLGHALAAVHAIGAVHRDVKPANILVRTQNAGSAIALADFGLAVDTSGHARARAGTLRYLAPEVRAEARASAASDLFGAGVVLLELARSPDPLPPAFDTIDGLADIEDVAGLLPDTVPRPWRERITRLLDPDPDRRAW